jgi:hypothetical protein
VQEGDARVVQRASDDNADAMPVTGPPQPIDTTATIYQSLRGAGMLMQEELDRQTEDLADPELGRLQAEEAAAEAARQAKDRRDDATRYERLTQFKLILQQKEYNYESVSLMLDPALATGKLSMRDLLVLKRFGMDFSASWFTRKKIRKRLIAAIQGYEEDWEAAHKGTPEFDEETRKYDEFLKLVQKDTERARAAYDPEVLEGIEGGIFGAIGYGIFGDEGAKLGAALDGVLFSLGSTYEHRMPSSAPAKQEDPMAEVRPFEQPPKAPEVKSEPPAKPAGPPPTAKPAEPLPAEKPAEPAKPTPPTAKQETTKNPPLNAKAAVEAKQRAEQNKTGLHEASKEVADAEHRLQAAQARLKAAQARVKPGTPAPPRLRETRARLRKEPDRDERLDLAREIRDSGVDWSPAEKEWLDAQVELLDAERDIEASTTAQTEQKGKVRDARIQAPERQKELARASKPVAALIRSRGRNYRAVSKVTFDSIMGETAWNGLKAKRSKAAGPLVLNTDHIVSVREIRDEVVK